MKQCEAENVGKSKCGANYDRNSATSIRRSVGANNRNLTKGVHSMKNGYAGKIKNQGSQMVKAPMNTTGAKKGTVKITGNDLRQGSKGGK